MSNARNNKSSEEKEKWHQKMGCPDHGGEELATMTPALALI